MPAGASRRIVRRGEHDRDDEPANGDQDRQHRGPADDEYGEVQLGEGVVHWTWPPGVTAWDVSRLFGSTAPVRVQAGPKIGSPCRFSPRRTSMLDAPKVGSSGGSAGRRGAAPCHLACCGFRLRASSVCEGCGAADIAAPKRRAPGCLYRILELSPRTRKPAAESG